MATEEIHNAKAIIRLKDCTDITLPNLSLSLTDSDLSDFADNLIGLTDFGDDIPDISIHKFVYSTIKGE